MQEIGAHKAATQSAVARCDELTAQLAALKAASAPLPATEDPTILDELRAEIVVLSEAREIADTRAAEAEADTVRLHEAYTEQCGSLRAVQDALVAHRKVESMLQEMCTKYVNIRADTLRQFKASRHKSSKMALLRKKKMLDFHYIAKHLH